MSHQTDNLWGVEGRSDVIIDELGVEVDGVEPECVAETEGRRDVIAPKLPVVDWSRSDCFTQKSPPLDWTTPKKSSMLPRTGERSTAPPGAIAAKSSKPCVQASRPSSARAACASGSSDQYGPR